MQIDPASSTFPTLAAACDFSFDITAEALPPFDQGRIVNVGPRAASRKTYPFDHRGSVRDHPLLAATESGRLLGYIALSRGWNGFAVIDDLAVDRSARRRGVGHRLLDAAAVQARAEGLAGLLAETQTDNVDACRFYENSGFVLGGFDRLLYAAIEQHQHETALFWYLLFMSPRTGSAAAPPPWAVRTGRS